MTAFKIVLRILFWCSVMLIITGFGVFIFLENHGTTIEFIDSKSESNWRAFSFIAMFAGMLLSLTGTLPKAEGFLDVTARIALTLFVMFMVYLYLVFSAFSLCSYYREEVIYENIHDSTIHIVTRSFGCGAVDSEPATLHVFKEEIKWNYFYIYEEADTSKLSSAEWKRVVQ